MRMIYIIIKMITLPGAITHAFFEHLCCRISKVIVDDGRVIQANEMLSHIDHALIRRKGPSFDICFIPFFLNLMLGLLTLSYGAVVIYYFVNLTDILAWFCLYFGISLLTNLFPQIEDVMMLRENIYTNGKNKAVKVLAAPFYGLFYIGAQLERVGLTLITSIAFSFAVPYILGWFVPAIHGLFK